MFICCSKHLTSGLSCILALYSPSCLLFTLAFICHLLPAFVVESAYSLTWHQATCEVYHLFGNFDRHIIYPHNCRDHGSSSNVDIYNIYIISASEIHCHLNSSKSRKFFIQEQFTLVIHHYWYLIAIHIYCHWNWN